MAVRRTPNGELHIHDLRCGVVNHQPSVAAPNAVEDAAGEGAPSRVTVVGAVDCPLILRT